MFDSPSTGFMKMQSLPTFIKNDRDPAAQQGLSIAQNYLIT
jgi:hypothetical protein